MRRSGLFLLVCLVLSGCLAACGGGSSSPGSLPALSGGPGSPGSSASPSSAAGATSSGGTGGAASPSVVPSESALPGVPPVPAAARAFTREGAEAFAAYWFDVLNAAQKTLDPSGIQAISQPGCFTCTNLTLSLQRSARIGEVYAGGTWTSVSNACAPLEADVADVTAEYDYTELRVNNAKGQQVDLVPSAKNAATNIRLQWTGTAWHVVEVQEV